MLENKELYTSSEYHFQSGEKGSPKDNTFADVELLLNEISRIKKRIYALNRIYPLTSFFLPCHHLFLLSIREGTFLCSRKRLGQIFIRRIWKPPIRFVGIRGKWKVIFLLIVFLFLLAPPVPQVIHESFHLTPCLV